MKATIYILVAGVTIPCVLRYPETIRFFPKKYITSECYTSNPVTLSDMEWDYYISSGLVEGPQTEFSVLSASFSDTLISLDRMIVHAVAIRRNDQAYLITAPSGIGKSTQAKYLQKLRPNEFGIICGDRPILEFKKLTPIFEESSSIKQVPVKKEIIVHPSPWNGKENWYGAEAAPLAGIIMLKRGTMNRVCLLEPKEAALSFFPQIIQSGIRPELIKKSASLETELLNSVPIWELTTNQVPDSTFKLLDAVF